MADTMIKGKGEHDGDDATKIESDTESPEYYDISSIFSEDSTDELTKLEEKTDYEKGPEKEEKFRKEETKKPIPELQPQAKLLWTLKHERFYEFVEMIKDPAVDIKFQYKKPQYSDYGTCIEIASRLPNKGKFVKALLEAGVKPNVHEILPEPIHYAAKEGNPDVLQVLLQDKRTNINIVDSKNRTALHHAVKYSNKGRDNKYAECITMLLKRHDFDINKPTKEGYTAIHEAANNRKEAVMLFLKYRHYDLDLDTHKARGRSARELILNKYPELRPVLPQMRLQKAAFDINTRLLLSLQNRELKDFTEILQRVDNDGDARVDPNSFYGRPYNATCLEIACREDDCADFVQQLLNAGADPNAVNPATKQIPLHLAAALGNEKIVYVLARHRKTNINTLNDESKSVLHIIAECERNENQIKCLKHVLGKRKRDSEDIAMRVNLVDNNGKMAVEIAVENNNKEFVNIMFQEAGKYMSLNETLFDVIRKMFPDLEERIPIRRDISQDDSAAALFQHLYNRNCEEFVSVLKTKGGDVFIDIDDGNYTLLQYAIIHGLKDPVKELLNVGANPNKTTDFEKRPPIIIASQRKNHELLRVFLENVPKGKLDVNVVDAKGNTALHFASKNEDLDCVVDLIRHGANYRIKNVFGKSPLPRDSVSCLLDKSLRTNGKFAEDEDYELTFDYEFLSASNQNFKPCTPLQDKTQQGLKKDPEADDGGRVSYITEMDFLLYLSESDEHRKLMRHPVIASFLEMKWFEHRFLSYLSLLICLLFVGLLNAYIILRIGEGEYKSTFHIEIFLWLYWAVLVITLICNVAFYPTKFIFIFVNWINIFVVICTAVLLIINYISPTLAVLTIFSSWFKLVLMTNHRTPLSINFEIFKTVSLNYFQFLLSYVSLILAFAFSFYSLFHGVARQQANDANHNKTIHAHYGYYMSPLLSIQKVFLMMMGEFEGNEFLPQIKDYEMCFWLLSLFVFLMAMVLVNLLTGLAVNDIQKIKENAIEVTLASRVRLFYELEKGPFNLVSLSKINKENKFYKHLLNSVKERFKIFPDKDSRKIIHIYPNKGSKIIFNDNRESTWKMDLNVLRDAIQIISNTDNSVDDFNIKQAFHQIKENYDCLLARFGNIEEKLGIHRN